LAVEYGDFRGFYSPTYWVAGDASARLFVHFVVFFLVFNTTKCLAMPAPAFDFGSLKRKYRKRLICFAING